MHERSTHGEIGRDAECRTRRWGKKAGVYSVIWIAVCLFLIGLGIARFSSSRHSLPGAYATLEKRGVRATARIDECAPGLGGGRGVACRLTLRFRGRMKTWVYPEDSSQFDGLPTHAPVSVLVDPENPELVYTAVDVHQRTNTGDVAYLGLFFAVPGALGLLAFGWFTFRLLPKLTGRSSI